MAYVFDMDAINDPNIQGKLNQLERLVIARVNEAIDFCNGTQKSTGPAEYLPKISSLFDDRALIPNPHRLSTNKMALRYDEQIIKRHFFRNDKDSPFTRVRDALKKRYESWEYQLEKLPHDSRFDRKRESLLHHSSAATTHIAVLEVCKVHAQSTLAEMACLDALATLCDRLITADQHEPISGLSPLEASLDALAEITLRHQLLDMRGTPVEEFSRKDVLQARNDFSDAYQRTLKALNKTSLARALKTSLKAQLKRAKQFYYNKNDINFIFPLKGTHSWSSMKHEYYDKGSKIGLACGSVSLLCAILVFLVPPSAVITAPIALATGITSLAFNGPIAIAKVSETASNAIRYGAAPSTAECVNLAFLSATVVTFGLGKAFAGPVIRITKEASRSTRISLSLVSQSAKHALREKQQAIEEEHEHIRPNYQEMPLGSAPIIRLSQSGYHFLAKPSAEGIIVSSQSLYFDEDTPRVLH